MEDLSEDESDCMSVKTELDLLNKFQEEEGEALYYPLQDFN